MNAKDLMTKDPRTVGVDDTVADAIEAIAAIDVRHLPVVDRDGKLVGMLAERDLLSIRADRSGGELNPPRTQPIARYLPNDPAREVVCIRASADVREIVDRMLAHRLAAIPVVDDGGRPIGLIGFGDVLRAYRNALGEGTRASRPEARA